MTEPAPQPVSLQPLSRWAALRPLAWCVAAASGALCAVIIVMLTWNYIERAGAEPLENETIAALRAELRTHLDANDKEKAQAVRDSVKAADLDIRQRYFRHDTAIRNGSWLLLACAVLLVLSLKFARRLGQTPPLPPDTPPAIPTAEEASENAGRARFAVGITGLLIAAVTVGWVVSAQLPQFVETPFDLGPVPTADQLAAHWHRLRGHGGAGVNLKSNAPAIWDGKSGANILWKTPVELPGYSGPVAWEDRVFITGARWLGDKEQDRRPVEQVLYCYNLADGTLRWQQPVGPGTGVRRDVKAYDEATLAAPSVATDGRVVAALFASCDLTVFDMDGKLIWQTELGAPETDYGYASSPIIVDNLLIVQYDMGHAHDLIAFDLQTGEEKWRTPREVKDSWATPVLIDTPAGRQIITASIESVVGHNAETGQVLWTVKGIGPDSDGAVACAPIYAGGMVIAINPQYSELIAIRPDGKGDVTETHVQWRVEYDDEFSSLASPVFDGKLLYLLGSYSFVAYDLETGTQPWAHMPDEFLASYGSPVLAGDRIYMPGEKGDVAVMKTGPKFDLLGYAKLGENFHTTPAIVGDRILIRADKHLYCIGADSKTPTEEPATP